MQKPYLMPFYIVLLLFLYPGQGWTMEEGVVVGKLNVRQGPDVEAKTIHYLKEGVQVIVKGTKGIWYLIRTPSDVEGWASSHFIAPLGFSFGQDAKILKNKIGVRKVPDKEYPAAFNLKRGEPVKVMNVREGWYMIRTSSWRWGWVESESIKLESSGIPVSPLIDGKTEVPIQEIEKVMEEDLEDEREVTYEDAMLAEGESVSKSGQFSEITGISVEEMEKLPSPITLEPDNDVFVEYDRDMKGFSKVNFKWEPMERATHYCLYVGKDSEVKDTVYSTKTKDNSVGVDELEDGIYYWYINAFDEAGRSSEPSVVQRFLLRESPKVTFDLMFMVLSGDIESQTEVHERDVLQGGIRSFQVSFDITLLKHLGLGASFSKSYLETNGKFEDMKGVRTFIGLDLFYRNQVLLLDRRLRYRLRAGFMQNKLDIDTILTDILKSHLIGFQMGGGVNYKIIGPLGIDIIIKYAPALSIYEGQTMGKTSIKNHYTSFNIGLEYYPICYLGVKLGYQIEKSHVDLNVGEVEDNYQQFFLGLKYSFL